MPEIETDDTIAALSTPAGEGGLAVIRLSGRLALPIARSSFQSSKNENLEKEPSHTIHYGHFVDHEGRMVDEGGAPDRETRGNDREGDLLPVIRRCVDGWWFHCLHRQPGNLR